MITIPNQSAKLQTLSDERTEGVPQKCPSWCVEHELLDEDSPADWTLIHTGILRTVTGSPGALSEVQLKRFDWADGKHETYIVLNDELLEVPTARATCEALTAAIGDVERDATA